MQIIRIDLRVASGGRDYTIPQRWQPNAKTILYSPELTNKWRFFSHQRERLLATYCRKSNKNHYTTENGLAPLVNWVERMRIECNTFIESFPYHSERIDFAVRLINAAGVSLSAAEISTAFSAFPTPESLAEQFCISFSAYALKKPTTEDDAFLQQTWTNELEGLYTDLVSERQAINDRLLSLYDLIMPLPRDAVAMLDEQLSTLEEACRLFPETHEAYGYLAQAAGRVAVPERSGEEQRRIAELCGAALDALCE